MHRPDAAACQAAHAIAVLVLDVARPIHRGRLRLPPPRPQPPLNPSFAPRNGLVSTRTHSKCPPASERSGLGTEKLCYGVRHFELFVYTPSRKHACTGSSYFVPLARSAVAT